MLRVLATGLCLVTAAARSAGPAPEPEAKLFAELYGKRLAAVRSTPQRQDDLDLARELLLAAADSANPLRLRHLLALEAARLAAPLGTREAARMAGEALRLGDSLRPIEPLEKANLGLQIAERRYAFARKHGATPAEARRLMGAVVGAKVALARALMRAERIEEARATLLKARSQARASRLGEQEADIEDAFKDLARCKARLAEIAAAKVALARAKEAGDPARISAARERLGLIYLLQDGDVAQAAPYLGGTKQACATAVVAGAEFLKNCKKLPKAGGCLEAVETLLKVATEAKNEAARVRVATVALEMVRAFLAAKPGGLLSTKARLLLVRAERLAGQSPADLYLRRLRKGYGGLAGKLELVCEGVVRASYDFRTRKHLGDWTVVRGAWQVLAGKGILACAPPRDGVGILSHRLRFRANRPLVFRYVASGRGNLRGYLFVLRSNSPRFVPRHVVFALGGNHNRGSYVRQGRRIVWSDPRARIAPGAAYRVEVRWDGKGGFTWSVNGRQLCAQALRFVPREIDTSSLYVGLGGRGQPAGFDDVSVEGTVLADPAKQLYLPRRKGS